MESITVRNGLKRAPHTCAYYLGYNSLVKVDIRFVHIF